MTFVGDNLEDPDDQDSRWPRLSEDSSQPLIYEEYGMLATRGWHPRAPSQIIYSDFGDFVNLYQETGMWVSGHVKVSPRFRMIWTWPSSWHYSRLTSERFEPSRPPSNPWVRCVQVSIRLDISIKKLNCPLHWTFQKHFVVDTFVGNNTLFFYENK